MKLKAMMQAPYEKIKSNEIKIIAFTDKTMQSVFRLESSLLYRL